MPNWCNNSIRINGDKKMISTLVRVIENTKDGEDRVFQSLIGYPDHMTKADYDKDWYDTNIGWFGTKWDVSYSSCNMEYDETEIRLYPDTAWSPPIEFLTNLVKQYEGIEAYIFYSEGGIGFSGETKIYRDEDGHISVDDSEYPYLEGIYLLDKELFWNSELESMIDSARDEITSDDEEDEDDVVKKIDEVKIVEYVNENFSFVTDEDKETIIKQFKEELND
jgi:hypothetical protein